MASSKAQATQILLECRGQVFRELQAAIARGELALISMQAFDSLTHAISHVHRLGEVLPFALAVREMEKRGGS